MGSPGSLELEGCGGGVGWGSVNVYMFLNRYENHICGCGAGAGRVEGIWGLGLGINGPAFEESLCPSVWRGDFNFCQTLSSPDSVKGGREDSVITQRVLMAAILTI